MFGRFVAAIAAILIIVAADIALAQEAQPVQVIARPLEQGAVEFGLRT